MSNTTRRSKFLKYIKNWPIIILLLVNLTIGILTYKDYGKSFDEDSLQYLADESLAAYTSGYNPIFGSIFGDELNVYGPSYVMGVHLITQFITKIIPSCSIIDLWHLFYFVTFQIGVLCLFLLAKRWMNDWAAICTAILFATQPLLWGHAFILTQKISLL